MIFPKPPAGVERDDTKHGTLYYTRDQLKKYGLQCVEEWVRCNQSGNQCESPDHLSESEFDFVSLLRGFKGGKT